MSKLVVDTEGTERRMPLGYGTALYNLSITRAPRQSFESFLACDSSDWIRGRGNPIGKERIGHEHEEGRGKDFHSSVYRLPERS